MLAPNVSIDKANNCLITDLSLVNTGNEYLQTTETGCGKNMI